MWEMSSQGGIGECGLIGCDLGGVRWHNKFGVLIMNLLTKVGELQGARLERAAPFPRCCTALREGKKVAMFLMQS